MRLDSADESLSASQAGSDSDPAMLGLGNAMSFNILLRSFLGLGSRLSGVSAQNEWLQLWGLCESVIAISNLSQMKNSVWFLGILFVKLLRLMSTVA